MRTSHSEHSNAATSTPMRGSLRPAVLEQLRYGIGKLLRSIRESRGLTQMEVAEILEISQSRLSKLEAGYTELSVIEWVQFCATMRVPVEKLAEVSSPTAARRS